MTFKKRPGKIAPRVELKRTEKMKVEEFPLTVDMSTFVEATIYDKEQGIQMLFLSIELALMAL